MGDQGEKVDNSTLEILNQSACFASPPDFDGFFRMNFRLYEVGAQVGKDWSYGCWMKIENLCEGRQGRVFVAGETMRIRVQVDMGKVMIAGFKLFHTRIKGLTSLVNKAQEQVCSNIWSTEICDF